MRVQKGAERGREEIGRKLEGGGKGKNEKRVVTFSSPREMEHEFWEINDNVEFTLLLAKFSSTGLCLACTLWRQRVRRVGCLVVLLLWAREDAGKVAAGLTGDDKPGLSK
ncbi:hypothetical protein MPH_09575 [Macrophomina phaseolina MS6]|uniref:Uncharacterized protein n=1 Tax=Macrophomina phaseolina (strain MS6) TaxID=1126212 RepID=K2RF97_MACPH|nr:hypothetical protein MPH_09575 [Macrophomina phaseolina MS6]